MIDKSHDVVEQMITDMFVSSPNATDLNKNPRILFYKNSGKAIDQERRWRCELEKIRSQTKRNNRFDSNRSCDEHCKVDTLLNQPSIAQSEKFTCDSWRSYSNTLMLAEWQLFRPPNFSEQYLMKHSPKGRHVLVHASKAWVEESNKWSDHDVEQCREICRDPPVLVATKKGRTNVISRTGHIILRTKSRLPGGGLAQSDNQNASYSTMLDCIKLRPDSGEKPALIQFAVLDLIRFRTTSYASLTFRERCLWLEDYLAQQLEEYSEDDPVCFKILRSVPCELPVLQRTLNQKPSIDLDGVLFYHEAVPYQPGPTPLVGWLKPFMLTEWLPEIQVHPDYCIETPPDYNDYKNEIRQQETKKTQQTLPMSTE